MNQYNWIITKYLCEKCDCFLKLDCNDKQDSISHLFCTNCGNEVYKEIKSNVFEVIEDDYI